MSVSRKTSEKMNTLYLQKLSNFVSPKIFELVYRVSNQIWVWVSDVVLVLRPKHKGLNIKTGLGLKTTFEVLRN